MSKAIAVVLPAADAASGRKKFLAFTSNPNLIAITIFATVGLLAAISFLVFLPFRFSNLGALIEQYDQF